MPPKASVIQQPSLSPPPINNDAQDLLVIQDLMDTLDQIPPELTRVHSDLSELGAVLYSTLVSLEKKLYTLIDWIQDSTVSPERRFELLQEIAEEAARYKLGGDDKIRVAAGACDGIMNHQRHISNLLTSSTLLNPSPPSPYTQALTLPFTQPVATSRRAARAVNSPFGGRGGYSGNAGPPEARVGDTPSKKKRSRVYQLGARDDDETSSVGGGEKKKPVKRRKQNRAVSPTDSIASTSAFSGRLMEPRTARQLAAAANKARREADDGGSDTESRAGNDRGAPLQPNFSTDSKALSLDVGSREGSGVRSTIVTPTFDYSTVMGSGLDAKRSSRRSNKRNAVGMGAGEEAEEEGEEEFDDDDKPEREDENLDGDIGGTVDDLDSKVYCTCRQVSYGEMIGCDDDECEIEWYHIGCLGLDRTPEGNWICPRCLDRRKKQPKTKKATRGKSRK
ncbi:hypothetical protein L204_106154 [Cryptococcus depauperatus]|nr:hypothetical protein L204_05713 [Cryptococcus depauperatus CBS 7855]